MIDLETMGTRPNAPIVAIGACKFTKDGVFDDHFYRTIDLKTAVGAAGGVIDPDTVKWWMAQEEPARLEIINAETSLLDALVAFWEWLPNDADGMWGNGANFDNVLLAETLRRFDMPVWPHWKDRCYRTMKNLVDFAPERVGTAHNALDDAITQAKHLVQVWCVLESYKVNMRGVPVTATDGAMKAAYSDGDSQ